MYIMTRNEFMITHSRAHMSGFPWRALRLGGDAFVVASSDADGSGREVCYENESGASCPGCSSLTTTMPSPTKRPLATPATEHKKRRRTSAEELRILEDAYVVNTLPSSEERARLAERTGMTPRAVQIWVSRRRLGSEGGDGRVDDVGFEREHSA